MLFVGEIIGDDVAPAIVADQDEVRTVTPKIAGKQQPGIRNIDGIRVARLRLNYGACAPITSVRRGRASHSCLKHARN